MKNRIEHEINKTLQYMDDGIDIRISDDFAANLNNRISNVKFTSSPGYRNQIYYSLVIIFFVILNVATLLMNFKEKEQVDNIANNQASVLASEYGIGQGNLSNI